MSDLERDEHQRKHRAMKQKKRRQRRKKEERRVIDLFKDMGQSKKRNSSQRVANSDVEIPQMDIQ